MIGRVLFDFGGVPAEAVLHEDGRWTVALLEERPDSSRVCQALAESLNLDLNLDDYSPADGQRGYAQLHEAARQLDGRVEAPEPGPGTPGMVY